MPKQDFLVNIDGHLVSVRLTVSPRGRFSACIFFIAILALAICGLLFLPGEHWQSKHVA